MSDYRMFFAALTLTLLAAMAGCSTVPKESVELSATVGRDLEEVHRAHRALAELHFDQIIGEVNAFVDETYRPAFIEQFAEEFRLADNIKKVLREEPAKLLPVMTGFVRIATERIENKRRALLGPIEAQRRAVLTSIDEAHRQIQSAQAIVTGHLASVRKVHDVQNEILAKAGLGDVRERVATKTSEVSDTVADMISKGKVLDAKVKNATEKITALDKAMDEAKDQLSADGK